MAEQVGPRAEAIPHGRGQQEERARFPGQGRPGRPVPWRRPGPGGPPIYAALDLGTNNCRLLVARPDGESFRVVDAFSRIVRLGEGLAASGRLSGAAIERSIEALKVCRDKMRSRNVTRSRLIATEAARAAANGSEFIDRVREEAGLELEIIDRATEARLAAAGCSPLVDPDAAGVVLFDIGGGSSEVVWLETPQGPRSEPIIRAWASFPVGVVTLAERYGGVAVSREVFGSMVEETEALVRSVPARAAISAALATLHMLGTSGTVTTIAGVHLGLPRYERRRVDGLWLTADEVTTVVDRLRVMSFEERVANPCIGSERADLVLAGCAILEGIRRVFPCKRLRVADRGLREGILVELMRADGMWRHGGPRR